MTPQTFRDTLNRAHTSSSLQGCLVDRLPGHRERDETAAAPFSIFPFVLLFSFPFRVLSPGAVHRACAPQLCAQCGGCVRLWRGLWCLVSLRGRRAVPY